jgi:hypothetical protein
VTPRTIDTLREGAARAVVARRREAAQVSGELGLRVLVAATRRRRSTVSVNP